MGGKAEDNQLITVYIDVLFAINFIINILIIEGCGVLICESTRWYRTLLSAFIGAIYSVVTFFPDLEIAASFIMKLALSGVMVVCAFKIKNKKQLIRLWGSFYVVSFIFGGSLIALMSLSGLGARFGAVYSNGTVYFNLPWRILLLSAGATYFLLVAFAHIRKRKVAREAIARELTIYINGQKIITKAIIDTGNTLFDPLTGDPVIVCEYTQFEEVLNKSGEESLVDKMRSAGFRIRLIPFTSVGKEKGLMPGFLPDEVRIDEYKVPRCIVGICENRLTNTEDYHALLNPMITVK